MQPPPGLIDATETHGVLHQVVAPAGSLVIFTEACLHGTLPWTAPHERRSMLYKFAPDAIAYGRQPHDLPPAYEAIEA